MKTCVALALWLFGAVCFAQGSPAGGPQNRAAYPESDAAAAWQGLAASYVRKAVKDQAVDRDPVHRLEIGRAHV